MLLFNIDCKYIYINKLRKNVLKPFTAYCKHQFEDNCIECVMVLIFSIIYFDNRLHLVIIFVYI